MTAAIPGSKTKKLKTLLKSKTGQTRNFSCWYFHPNFTPPYTLRLSTTILSSSDLILRKHRTLMTSITYGPFHFVVLFWKLKQLHTHITFKNNKIEPSFRILYTNPSGKQVSREVPKEIIQVKLFWIYSWLSLNTMKKTVKHNLNGICAWSFRGLLTVIKLCVSPAGVGIKDVRGTWPRVG